MAHQKSKIAKVFIFITLIAIVFASFAIYIAMYAWFNAQNNNPCDEWYIRNAETQECEEQIIENIEEITEEEKCTEQGWTWYAENNICILPDAQ